MTLDRKRISFWYLFALFFTAAVSETLVSPLFPLIKNDIHLRTADLALITGALTLMTGLGNLAGGVIGVRRSDRLAIRLAAFFITGGSLLTAISGNLLIIVIGQMLIGGGSGLFFAPGLSSVSRLFEKNRGRAIASYGLAYSLGLAVASFCANKIAPPWRINYLLISIVAVCLSIKVPDLKENVESVNLGLQKMAIEYSKNSSYRLALMCGVVAGTTHYLVIGLIPEAFVDRGVALALVTGLVGIGRLASMPGKYAAGWAFDRWGGPRSAQAVMSLMLCFGFFVLVLPPKLGLIPIIPFVCFTAMLFPISNAIVIGALPAKSSLGVGIYRASLMISSAVLSILFSIALRHFGTFQVMLWALTIPVVGILFNHRSTHSRAKSNK